MRLVRGLPFAVIFAAALQLLSHQTTLAHGPNPAALGPPAGVQADAGVIRLSSGLAIREERGVWRYMCPAAWGGPGAPLVIADDSISDSTGDSGVWVLGDDGPALWTGAWSLSSELSSRSALELATLDGQVWALTRLDGQTELISLNSASRYSLSEPWSSPHKDQEPLS